MLAPKSFSNPYVDWNERARVHADMWDALTNSVCERFRHYTREYGVTYVMTVEGETPLIAGASCDLLSAARFGRRIQIYLVTD